jgi:hypothetical protein
MSPSVRNVSMANSFLSSLAGLDSTSAKRTAAFLDKLVRDPGSGSIHTEIVNDARDRTIRSLRVTGDLRAIAHVDGDELLLLHVGKHDEAYAWARDRCVECHPVTGELQIVAVPDAAASRLAALAAAGREREAAQDRVVTQELPGLFDPVTDEYLLSLGVPPSWLATVRMVKSEDMFFAIADDLPEGVRERLLRLATGELPQSVLAENDCRTDGDDVNEPPTQSWICTVEDGQSLCRVLDEIGIEHGLDP